MEQPKSKYIPFIHNYCDRWCERCAFTRLCAVYETSETGGTEEKHKTHEAFRERLQHNFEKALALLDKRAKDFGIDPAELQQIGEEEGKKLEQKKQLLDEQELNQLARDYGAAAQAMLKDEVFWEGRLDELSDAAEAAMVEAVQIDDEVKMLKECREVIAWYMFFIEAKVNRALSGKLDDYSDWADIQTDYNGSAKVALIAIQNSIDAWALLLSRNYDEDKILPLLACLSKLKNGMLREFPKAENFVRPGFDDAPIG